MTNQVRFGLAALLMAFFLSSPNLARGQQGAPRASVRPSPAPVHARMPVGAHTIASRPSSRRSVGATENAMGFNGSANSFGLGDGSFASLQDLLNPVPGLGFDYAHLAAMNSDLAIKAVIDPATQWKLAVAERVLRDTGGIAPTGGYLLFDGGGDYAEPAPTPAQQSQQPPQIIVLQQAPPAKESAAQPAPAVAPEPAPQAAPPLPDVGQFTLVLLNGTKIQAVAFTRLNDRIVYITADGRRHTIALSDLDADATVRINEERGTPLHLPL